MDKKEELFDLIQYHNKKYWIDNNPEINDIEYDQLVIKYINLGGKLEDFKFEENFKSSNKYRHLTPMLSLDKAYTVEEVIEWATKIKRTDHEIFLFQPKYDGWAGKYLIHENKLITRGDGYIGEDISSKLPLINFYIFEIPEKSEYLGEIIISKKDFEKYKNILVRSNGEPYKTPRTCLTGLLGSKNINIPNDIKPLTFVEYITRSVEFTYEELLYKTEELFKDYENYIKELEFPCDGLVIKLKDEIYFNKLGNTSHHPYGAIAYKFGNPTGKSILKNIEWFVGKNNSLNPVGIIEPVLINGHTISKVSLHNAQNILDLNLHIGDEVIVERCGEIIPHIIKVINKKNNNIELLKNCPSCNYPTIFESPTLYCSNPECSDSIVKRLHDSCKRLEIKNIGPEIVDDIVQYLNIYFIDELLSITKDELLTLPRFAEVSANKVYESIQEIVNNPIEDYKVLSALNINGIGIDISKVILNNFTLDELLKPVQYEDLLNVPGLSHKRVNDLLDGLDSNIDVLCNLKNKLKIIETKNTNKQNLPKVCFTGKMPQTRSYYEKLASEKGYESVSTITKDLSLLVTSDLDRKSSKMDKAKKLGIKIITLNEFLNK